MFDSKVSVLNQDAELLMFITTELVDGLAVWAEWKEEATTTPG